MDCGTPLWHMSPERRSPHAPAQDIRTHVTTMQHSGNIITQSGPEGYKWFTWPSRHENIMAKYSTGQGLTGSGRHRYGNGLVRLHSTGIWLGY